MQAFTRHQGIAAPLTEAGVLRRNVDTDAIIPSREMKQVSKTSLAEGLFANWRYLSPDSRELNKDFVLNQAPYQNTSILIAGENFGCGSSREQAVWALAEFGIRAVIAPSFGAIFTRNCVANGLLTLALDASAALRVADWVRLDPLANQPRIDLEAQQVQAASTQFAFSFPPADRRRLLNGLDEIESTLRDIAKIEAFEQGYVKHTPWASLG